MAEIITAQGLRGLIDGNSQFALIDVRESGEYNSSHIPGASLIPRRRIEYIIESSVPAKGVPVVVCDDDGRRAPLAAATLKRLGYTNVSVLEGGVNRWSSRDYPTEWGVNVPSKDFGEKLEAVYHVPEISAEDLHERIERGDKLVILDTRLPRNTGGSAYRAGAVCPAASWPCASPTFKTRSTKTRPSFSTAPAAPAASPGPGCSNAWESRPWD